MSSTHFTRASCLKGSCCAKMDELPHAKRKKSVQVGPGKSSSSRHTRRQVDFASTLEQAASSNIATNEDTNLDVDIDKQHLQNISLDERNEEDGQNVVGGIEENKGDQNEGDNTHGGDNEDEGENTENNGREIEGEENTHPLEDQEETVVITQTKGSSRKKLRLRFFGKILETSTPQALLDRIGVKFKSPPQCVSLYRMIQT